MTKRTTLAVLVAAALGGSVTAEPTTQNVPPPAAPAPPEASTPDADLSAQLDQLAQARREVLKAERELRSANSALARAERAGNVSALRLQLISSRQEHAQNAFDAARRRVPELVTQARAAGLSASAVRSYEHSLYGD